MNKIVIICCLIILLFSCKRITNKKSFSEETFDNYIQFDDFSIKNIISSESYFRMIEKYGEPDRTYELLLITDKYSVKNKRKYRIPILVYQNNGLEYFKYKDSVQLYSINFELCKISNIFFYDKQLNRKTTIQKFCKYYNVSNNYITEVDANWTHYPDTNIGYQLLWITDSIDKECTEFYFDRNKRLKYINFGFRNGGILH